MIVESPIHLKRKIEREYQSFGHTIEMEVDIATLIVVFDDTNRLKHLLKFELLDFLGLGKAWKLYE